MKESDVLELLEAKAKTVEDWVHEKYDKSWDCCCSCGETAACQDNTVECPFQGVKILELDDVAAAVEPLVVLHLKEADMLRQNLADSNFKIEALEKQLDELRRLWEKIPSSLQVKTIHGVEVIGFQPKRWKAYVKKVESALNKKESK